MTIPIDNAINKQANKAFPKSLNIFQSSVVNVSTYQHNKNKEATTDVIDYK